MLDYDCAIELAKGFQAEGPRAIATIAIARALNREQAWSFDHYQQKRKSTH